MIRFLNNYKGVVVFYVVIAIISLIFVFRVQTDNSQTQVSNVVTENCFA